MAQDKKFSVVIPIYKDNWKTLDSCLFHLKEQDYKNLEVLIVYNSPTLAASKKGVEEQLAKHPWLEKSPAQIIKLDAGYKKELGQGNHCAAFNKGASYACGDYLLFLDPDIQILPGILREYKDTFDAHPDVSFVYGDYDFSGNVGRIKGRRYNEYELRCANYISGAFPIKKEAFTCWDPAVKSLQDWDMWYSAIDAGAKGFYIDSRPCFIAAVPEAKGISAEGAEKWKERYAFVREKHGFPVSDTVVTSLGAPDHASNTAQLLHVDTRVLSNIHTFKPNDYQNVYLIGFYSRGPEEDPTMAVRNHLSLFYKGGDLKGELVPGKKIIHWVGTDIFMLQHYTSWTGVKFIASMLTDPDLGFVHLSECEATYKELLELGIESKIVPLPPARLFSPMSLPADFTIGVYTNPTQDMYFEESMQELAQSLPDIPFKFFGTRGVYRKEDNREWVGWVDMERFLPTISLLVRTTRHDGLPLGPVEAMTAGRQVITTLPLKYGTTHTLKNSEPDIPTLIEQIRAAQQTTLDPKASDYWRRELSHDLFRERIAKILA